jgi:signal transduction histidine kinase
LVRVHNGSEPQQLSLLTTQLNLRDRRITLASFQNITTELSAKEMDAWENLIRVLTHEIRNSLTPISSLAATVEESFRKEESDRFSLRQSDREDMFEALSTIRRRSDGLLGFVDSYRRLTRISKPSLTTVNVDDLLSDTTKLMQSEFKNRTVKLSHETIPKDLTIIADSQLSSQVLVNLVKNAIEAIGEQAGGEVHIRAFQDNYGHARITVTDNGPGIVPEALDQIFVPLYTTKKGGSGIGLSLSRQIMRLHHGGLTVSSDPGRETVFAMIF